MSSESQSHSVPPAKRRKTGTVNESETGMEKKLLRLAELQKRANELRAKPGPSGNTTNNSGEGGQAVLVNSGVTGTNTSSTSNLVNHGGPGLTGNMSDQSNSTQLSSNLKLNNTLPYINLAENASDPTGNSTITTTTNSALSNSSSSVISNGGGSSAPPPLK